MQGLSAAGPVGLAKTFTVRSPFKTLRRAKEVHGICIALPNSATSTDNDNADDSDKINFKENPGHQTGCGRHLPVPGVRTPQRDETGGRGRREDGEGGWGVARARRPHF